MNLTRLFALACIAAASAQRNDAETCALDFVENCLATADPSTCQTCVKSAPAGDCSLPEQLLFAAVCQKAPFTSSTEDCIKEVVVDCKDKFTDAKDCEQCVLLHTPDLKNANCSTADLAGVVGLCSQIKPAPAPTPGPPTPPTPPSPGPAPGNSHYEDPGATGTCLPDEQAVKITGIDGSFCSPDCESAACPTDVPAGVTAAPQCALKASTGTDKKCALICSPTAEANECGTATCKPISGTGICTYNDGTVVGTNSTLGDFVFSL